MTRRHRDKNRSVRRTPFHKLLHRETNGRALHVELLESRLLLSGDTFSAYARVTPDWFGQTVDLAIESNVGATAEGEVAITAKTYDRWVVRLTPEATSQIASVADASALLQADNISIASVRGLGLPGQLLVETSGTDVASALASNPHLAYFQTDAAIGAQLLPDDLQFSDLYGLNNTGQTGGTFDADIDAPEAWDITTGSYDVVVGLIDSGADYTHPDLANNIWINQGELPQFVQDNFASIDVDSDGRITFADLNDSLNAPFTSDINLNGFIDAGDLLFDPGWSDGIDTEANGFIDDLFGWDFRNSDRDPQDDHGHGTHVAGTLGAVGNNSSGVTGVNWNTSIMLLKFLDDTNSGFTSDAIQAVNYATMMRTDFGENVRVTNNSWGTLGGFDLGLQDAIEASGDADMLFVAAAGNGNILGQGINLDQQPFYPASYDLDNILAVGATDQNDTLASFSNLGIGTVDIGAPGIGILSTNLGGGLLSRNGTSMATPHVTGTAALLAANKPNATALEIRAAILAGADVVPSLNGQIADSRRLNAFGALTAPTFAPRATLISAPDITTAGGTTQTITIRYTDEEGVDLASLDDADLVITRTGFSAVQLNVTIVPGSIVGPNTDFTVDYELADPVGGWGAVDNGTYTINLQLGEVRDVQDIANGQQVIDSFAIDIIDASVFFVNSTVDAVDANPGDGLAEDANGNTTLRAAIQEANALAGDNTIVVPDGLYVLGLPGPNEDAAATGDLDITDTSGTLTIVGGSTDSTIIDANQLDRVFDVHASSALTLSIVKLQHGSADFGGGLRNVLGTVDIVLAAIDGNRAIKDGGGVFTTGVMTIIQTTISNNTTIDSLSIGGGGIFNDGQLTIEQSTLFGNVAAGGFIAEGGGGGLFNANNGVTDITYSTFSGNVATNGDGGGIYNSDELTLTNNTIYENRAELGEGGGIFNRSAGSGQFTYSFDSQFGTNGAPHGRFFEVHDVAVDAIGNIFVADRRNNRIQVFDSGGIFLFDFGSLGTEEGKFFKPRGVAVDSASNIYVTDTLNHRIQVFDPAGSFLFAFGTEGSGQGQFDRPHGVAISSSGDIYVADRENDRIQAFDSNGLFQFEFGDFGAGEIIDPTNVHVDASDRVYVTDDAGRVVIYDLSGTFISTFGTPGSSSGQFTSPRGVATDVAGNIYIVDTIFESGELQGRVQLFDANGVFLSTISQEEGSYVGVAVDNAGNIHVADGFFKNERIRIFDAAGSLVHEFGEPTTRSPTQHVVVDNTGRIWTSDRNNHRIVVFDQAGALDFVVGEKGSGNGQFNRPGGLAINGVGDVYVTDTENDRVQVFDSAGAFLFSFGAVDPGVGLFDNPTSVGIGGSGEVYILDPGNSLIQVFSGSGVFQRQFAGPAFTDHITVDIFDNVYVTSGSNVKVFDSNGNVLQDFDTTIAGDAAFVAATGVAVDGAGNIFVADSSSHRIKQFTSTGTLLSAFGANGSTDGLFESPEGLALDTAGNLHVLDSGNRRLQVFDNVQSFVSKSGIRADFDGNSSRGIAVDSKDLAIVADTLNHQIQVFDAKGKLLFEFGGFGTAIGRFDRPGAVAVDASDNIYVADTGNHRVQVFDNAGSFLMAIGSEGTAQGEFRAPSGIEVDSTGMIYVSDTRNDRIQIFSPDGSFSSAFGSTGSLDGEFLEPAGIAIDGKGRVWVADSGNHRVQKFDADGSYLTQFGSRGSAIGGGSTIEFNSPRDIAVDTILSFIQIYVTDSDNHRFLMIAEIGTSFTQLSSTGSFGSSDSQFSYPLGIAVSNTGRVLVTNRDNDRVQVFTQAGLGQVITQNTIIAGNTALTNVDISGNYTGRGHNFVGNIGTATSLSASTRDLIGDDLNPLDPMLGPLQKNGFATATHALLPGSPAIDRGSNNANSDVDQRGLPIPQDASLSKLFSAPTHASDANVNFSGITLLNGDIYFLFSSIIRKYDTQNDTVVFVADFPRVSGGTTTEMIAVGDQLFFEGDDGIVGRELFKYDLVTDTVSLAADIEPNGFSQPRELVELNGDLYFTASGVTLGNQLYRYDPGTGVAVPITAFASGGPHRLMPFNGALYFAGPALTGGEEIFKFDPIADTISLAADITPGPDLTTFESMFLLLNDTFYFLARAIGQSSANKLYSFQPSSGDVSALVDLGAISSNSELVVVGDRIYFVTDDDTNEDHIVEYDVQLDELSTVVTFADLGITDPDSFPSIFFRDLVSSDGKLIFNASVVDPFETETRSTFAAFDPITRGVSVSAGAAPSFGSYGPGLSHYFELDGLLYTRDPLVTGLATIDTNSPPVDIGAVERTFGEIRGTKFLDANGDGIQQIDETGLGGWTIFVDLDEDGVFDAGEPSAVTRADDPSTTFVDEAGAYILTGILPGDHQIREVPQTGFDATFPVLLDGAAVPSFFTVADTTTALPEDVGVIFDLFQEASIVGDNLVVLGQSGSLGGVFRMTVGGQLEELVRFDATGATGTPIPGGTSKFTAISQITQNGETVEFFGTNDGFLQAGFYKVGNASETGIVADLNTPIPAAVSFPGSTGNFFNFGTISVSGNLTAITGSDESQLTHGAYVVSDVGSINTLANQDTLDPRGGDFSAGNIQFGPVYVDGNRFAVTIGDGTSTAIFLGSGQDPLTLIADQATSIPGLTGTISDLFGFTLFEDTVTLRADLSSGEKGIFNGISSSALQAVVDTSTAIPEGVGNFTDFGQDIAQGGGSLVFVGSGFAQQGIYTTLGGSLRKVIDLNDMLDGKVTTAFQIGLEAISGNQIIFRADFIDGSSGVYVANFPSESKHVITLTPGEVLDNINFGNRSLPGEIRGQKFEDLDGDGEKDPGEPGLAGWTIYLDQNNNSVLDTSEASTTTDVDGNYAFTNQSTLTTYNVAEVPQTGWDQTFPSAADNGKWSIFLNAGEVRTQVNFGNRESGTGGVGNDGVLQGRVFSDFNGDGIQNGSDAGLAGRTVFLDLNNNGTFDVAPGVPEPNSTTAASGDYEFSNLSAGNYAVRLVTLVDEQLVAPLGNVLTLNDLDAGDGNDTTGVVTADFDGQNGPDIAAFNASTNNVSIFLNDGNGQFQDANNIDVNSGPTSMVVGHFNDDLFPDLAVSHFSSATVVILLGNGAGGFTRAPDVPVPAGFSGIAAADFDLDGFDDLAVAVDNSNAVTILMNNGLTNGSASFTTVASVGTGNRPIAITAAHVDADLLPDLVVGNFLDDTIQVLINTGSGTFSAQAPLPVGVGPLSIAVAELNGDNAPDIAVANTFSNNVSLLLSDGSGGFLSAVSAPAGLGPRAIDSIDLEGDGDIDLVVGNLTSSEVSLLRNDGQGNFSAPENLGVGNLSGATGLGVKGIVAEDFSGDGITDIAAAKGNSFNGFVSVLENAITVGAHRVVGDGQSTVENLNFAIQANTPILGDYDSNGTVGPEDLVVWEGAYGSTTNLSADGNGDGIVSGGDFLLWQRNLAPGSLSAVGAGFAFVSAEVEFSADPSIPVDRRVENLESQADIASISLADLAGVLHSYIQGETGYKDTQVTRAAIQREISREVRAAFRDIYDDQARLLIDELFDRIPAREGYRPALRDSETSHFDFQGELDSLEIAWQTWDSL